MSVFDTPKTGIPFTGGTGNLTAYNARIASDPTYKASKSSDKVGWIVQNYGKEWLKPDGTAPDEAVWTYTGGQNGQPKIGSVTGINYLPWNDKNAKYDQANGQDYSRPQYANGPNGMPTGGYKGTEAEIQADRDANNWYRNGGKGMSPAMLASISQIGPNGLKGLPRDSYNLPGGSVYNREKGVTKANPWGVNASFSGPGGSWQQDHWGKQMQNGIWKGMYPGQGTMEAKGINGFSPTGNASNHVNPGQFIPGGRTTPPGGGQQGGPVPMQGSPYMGLPPAQQAQARQARGPWMQQMDSTDAMAAQIAQAAALRGTNG